MLISFIQSYSTNLCHWFQNPEHKAPPNPTPPLRHQVWRMMTQLLALRHVAHVQEPPPLHLILVLVLVLVLVLHWRMMISLRQAVMKVLHQKLCCRWRTMLLKTFE